MKWLCGVSLILFAIIFPSMSQRVPEPATDSVVIRGHSQTVHVYGKRGAGTPIVVSSGDGGWVHLAPHVAELLAADHRFSDNTAEFDQRLLVAIAWVKQNQTR